MGGRAFIVTQSIKKLSDTLKKAVFTDYDYKLLSDATHITIDEMKNEYERNFNKKCYVLNKSYDFISRPPSKEIIFPIKMLYMRCV